MGAWGSSAFDNDDAADWAWGLDDDGDGALVRSALVLDDVEYVELPEGATAIAAAEIVAACLGRPGAHPLPDAVQAWVDAHGSAFRGGDAASALNAVRRVAAEGSELSELWAETEDQDWARAVDDLTTRLSAVAS